MAQQTADAWQPSQWDGVLGAHRARNAAFYDEELRRYQPLFRAAIDAGPRDRILDVGCGTGQTTRAAARDARDGSVLGVDLSSEMLRRAREITTQEGLRNVEYVQADAQVHTFPTGGFDLAISRFGVMFFADPVIAFGNIARALRPDGRLVLLVWQSEGGMEWARAIREALSPGQPAPARSRTGNPFSLADPAANRALLTTAGFTEIDHVDLREPIYYGETADEALAAVRGLGVVREPLERLDQAGVDAALARLRDTLAAHQRADGVWFDSRVWLITAVRPPATR